MLWVGLQCVIVVFPDHIHLLCSVGIIVQLNFLNRFSDKAEFRNLRSWEVTVGSSLHFMWNTRILLGLKLVQMLTVMPYKPIMLPYRLSLFVLFYVYFNQLLHFSLDR